MSEVGIKLKEARESKGMTLEDVYVRTKIQPQMLSALEMGDYDVFSGEVYIKGALRNYAEAVGLNYAEVRELYEPKQQEDKVDGDMGEAAAPPPRERDKVQKDILLSTKPVRSGRKKPFILFRFLIYILGLALLLSVLYFGATWLINREPAEEDPNAPAGVIDGDLEDDEAANPDEVYEDMEEDVAPSMVLEKIEAGKEDYILRGPDKIEVVIEFRGDCWIRITEAGEKAHSGTFRNGQNYTFSSDKELIVRLGNPRGVEILTVNDEELVVPNTGVAYNITLRMEE